MTVWEGENLRIEKHESQIPWLKVFTLDSYREMSEVPLQLRVEIFEVLDTIEKVMISYYNPTKINIASFGNYLPHVHWHIMARFQEDSHFPECMWGVQQRDSELKLPPFDKFIELLQEKL